MALLTYVAGTVIPMSGWLQTYANETATQQPPLDLDDMFEFPAVVNSINRSTDNRAPNHYLPFDPIGAQHPGIMALSGHTPAAAVGRPSRGCKLG